MKEKAPSVNHLILGFCLGAFISYTFLTSRHIGYELAIMMTVFNFLYVPLTFPLNGKLTIKLLMLSLGNIVGLLWNILFSTFASVAAHYGGGLFSILYIILSPFVNLVWIVSFWSTSLTVLGKPETRRQGPRFDN